jgi:hypothetical protein
MEEELSDVEGEEPYYPETERVYVTTTRSGRSVYTPRRLVVEEYEEVSSDSEGPSSIDTQSTDATFTDSVPEEDLPTSEESEEGEDSDEEGGTTSSSSPSSTPTA